MWICESIFARKKRWLIIAGIATTIPPAVLYSATEIPLANISTSCPSLVNELKSSTIPIIVPNKPSNGATVEIIANI